LESLQNAGKTSAQGFSEFGQTLRLAAWQNSGERGSAPASPETFAPSSTCRQNIKVACQHLLKNFSRRTM